MESISKISSLLEQARDLTLEAARDAGPRRTAKTLPAAQIKKMLDSKHEREVLDGLRKVVAMQYANPPQPTLTFFPAVLKTLSNPYPSTRPLVYNYLIHHAAADPDTALLAINTIQKSLSDTNPRVRAMALKTMSGIRIPMIAQIISLAIKKGVNDLSPLVRKAAALACVKCVQLDESTRPQIEDYVSTLLGDQQYYVAGAAVQAFMEVCPDRLDLIHPVYRRLCKMLVDMDEWGQLAVIRLFTGYSRRCFPRRTTRVKRASTQAQRAKDFYEDLEPEEETEEDFEEVEAMDPDLGLFLKSIQPLLSSRNSAVILAVTRAYLYLAPSTHLGKAIGPLMALLRSPQDIRQVALYNVVQVCLIDPTQFVTYFRHFLVRSTEAPQIWRLKLEVLTLIFPHSGKEIQELILAELEHFSKGHDTNLVRESVRAIGRCAQASSDRTSRRCLSLLLKQIRSPDANLVGEAMEVIRHLIQRAPDEHRKTVIRLAKNLDTLTSPSARASIVWLIGEFAGVDPENNIAADVLRILVKNYTDESDEVRVQTVLLAAKVYLHFLNAKNEKQKAIDALHQETKPIQDDTLPQEEAGSKHPIEVLYQYTMLLARYTPSYSLRDRARLFRSLLSVQSSTELATLLLLAPKPVPQAPSPSESRKTLLLGTTSLVIGSEAGTTGMRGYEALPEWVESGREPDPKLRDDGDRAIQRGAYVPERELTAAQRLDEGLEKDPGYKSKVAGMPKKEKTLDAWLDEESESEEEESEEEEETDSAEEETDEEEESEYETESEDDERAGLVKS
ncbi:hypothetical protein CERZMDRAFT_32823 [Cercospora zeae-maydis SCOH1-5]|uniref:Clathrin/coatomer adaptor adaptin-like N-terminal domain-containing protein n=1 Tax=Cercospora zeae-maydis SCOH1-5 TaxID=717836 RepID=A0A6A6FVI7_9PEZI|nr:hypothetical protein CERZMDRAFT_32823 [Cercospora zeae-maydis SCOH1-5]